MKSMKFFDILFLATISIFTISPISTLAGTEKGLRYCSFIGASASNNHLHIRRTQCIVTQGASLSYSFIILQWDDGKVTNINLKKVSDWIIYSSGEIPPHIAIRVNNVLGRVNVPVILNLKTGNLFIIEDLTTEDMERCKFRAISRGENISNAGSISSADVCWIGNAAYSINWNGEGLRDIQIRKRE